MKHISKKDERINTTHSNAGDKGETNTTRMTRYHVFKLPFSSVSAETAGLPPGSPRYIGDVEPTLATYSLYSYDENSAGHRGYSRYGAQAKARKL